MDAAIICLRYPSRLNAIHGILLGNFSVTKLESGGSHLSAVRARAVPLAVIHAFLRNQAAVEDTIALLAANPASWTQRWQSGRNFGVSGRASPPLLRREPDARRVSPPHTRLGGAL
jgi:hypothetical protein